MKCKGLYEQRLRSQSEVIPEDKQLKFLNHWIRDWMAGDLPSLKKKEKHASLNWLRMF